ncbi:hypothetical protein [Paludisphaera mucosa]|uniref:Uncharacterized protein n=1 Tax=Paludisphaera mucosa TaxID=3030827 RepID=A0ABT6F7G3_9BACT|nr:hypothetical protein [Paludisphaera mucosa]MDG3003515.1 hypothetical protein [Paludisphaera mucosa]
MGWTDSTWIWAQAAGVGSPAAAAYAALRRWCGGLTLAPSRPVPDWGVLGVLAAAPALLVFLAMIGQGPASTLKQILDVSGHLRLLREATARVWRAGRLVTALLGFTVLSWTGSQCLAFFFEDAERGRTDLLVLKRGRGPIELLLEHAATSTATPLRDLAGLADNLPLLAAAVAVVLSVGSLRPAGTGLVRTHNLRPASGSFDRESSWRSVVGICLVLYLLYRLFSRVAGGGALPVGNCLVLEVAIVPGLMLVCDGFLMAWILAELRDGEPGDDQVGRIDPSRALRLLPAAALGCLAALPARYAATAVLLASQHVPAAVMATWFGGLVRWSLGPGLLVLQALSLATMGIAGAIAWSRGSIDEAWLGYRRLVEREGGRIAVVSVLAGVGCGVLSAGAYSLLLLLPPAGWVLPAADAYAHYATFPVGLWTLSAFIHLAERTLPTARRRDVSPDRMDVEPSAVDGDFASVVEGSSSPKLD